MNENSNNKRIAKNTMYLYIRMFFTLIIGLYSSRVILATLGVSDYGLYNVVGGVVTMFMFINGTLASGTQRFLSYAIGQHNELNLNKVFSTALLLHFLFALLIFIIAETIGLWLLFNKLNIPEGRSYAAFWVYQFSVLASMVTVMQVPFMSSIISHEKMDIYAYMSIYDVAMKLVILLLITLVSYDKLVLYAFLILLVNITSAIIYNSYCRRIFSECTFKLRLDKKIFKEIASFSGWNVFGCAAASLQGQGVNILLNIFFDTSINAARGIALQVNGIIMQFVSNYQIAVNPQIVKLFASGEKSKMFDLVFANTKFGVYLFLLIAIPVFVEIEYILDIWLCDYPDYLVPFLRIILFQSVIQTITKPCVMVIHAIGKMKMPNITAGGALLLIVPISYIFLKLGCDPVTIFLINIVPFFIENYFELYYMKKYIGFPMLDFYKKVYGKVFPLMILMVLVPLVVQHCLPFDGFLRFVIVGFISVTNSVLMILYCGLEKKTRMLLIDYIHRKVRLYINF